MEANYTHSNDESVDEKLEMEEIVKQLPRTQGWKAKSLYQYQGFWYLDAEAIMRLQRHFKAEPSDVILVSFPKSGTTWLKALVFSIINRGAHNNCDNSPISLTTKGPHECVPCLEFDFESRGFFRNEPDPRILATHISITSLPPSVASSGCKVVYICRDPKDVFVSLCHFILKVDGHIEPLSIKRTYEMFCNGVCPSGPYWDHVLEYWNASLAEPDRVLFLQYEKLKKDPLVYVHKLAEFLGRPFTMEEENENVAQGIVEFCSFKSLSNLQVNKDGVYRTDSFEVENNKYLRRGEVGDWVNYLTSEMADKLDKITRQKLDNSGLALD